jgi:hypothetical protein
VQQAKKMSTASAFSSLRVAASRPQAKGGRRGHIKDNADFIGIIKLGICESQAYQLCYMAGG